MESTIYLEVQAKAAMLPVQVYCLEYCESDIRCHDEAKCEPDIFFSDGTSYCGMLQISYDTTDPFSKINLNWEHGVCYTDDFGKQHEITDESLLEKLAKLAFDNK